MDTRCTPFNIQEADCVRLWSGLARIAAAIEFHGKGHLLVAACEKLEKKNSLSPALFKEYSNFDDRSCLQFLEWLCNPSNYGTATHGQVSRALQQIEVEYLVSRQILHPDNDLVHPSQSMLSTPFRLPVPEIFRRIW